MFRAVRHSALLAGLLAVSAMPAVPAHAVASPGAISWSATPAAFVTSLYNGVLGRPPESGAVVAGWATNVTSNPSSRLSVFKRFVGSAEYRSSFGSTRGDYTLGYKVNGNRVTWAVYRGFNASYTGHTSGISFGYASAMRGYYNTYANRR